MHGSKSLPSTAHSNDVVPLERRSLILATLCAAVLVAQLDTSVVNLAMRPIGEGFGVGVGPLQWIVDSYNLVYAVLLLTGGILADLYGRRRIFMAGAAVFTAASLVCAAAPTVAVLIGGRAIAGVGAALMLPASLAIIRVVWPNARERGRAIGIWAACNGLAFVVGPTVGGLLIGRFGWRSIFLVVVPLALAALLLTPFCVPESADPRGRRFNAPAQVLGGLSLGAFALAAIESHGSAVLATVAFVVALAALFLFVRVERAKGVGALVPLDMFASTTFRGAIAATAGMTFGMYGVLFLVPLTWQASGVLGPVGVGIALMPMAVAFAGLSPFSGSLSDRFGSRLMASGGVALIGCGLVVIGWTAASKALLAAEAGLVLTGIGMGLATGPLMAVAVGAFSAARSGTAAALINVARMVGATIGVAVLGTLFVAEAGHADGLRLAMFVGGAAQLAAAAVAWMAMRPSPPGR